MYSSTVFLTSALKGGEGSTSHPGRSLPPGKTRYPLYRRLGGLRACLDRFGKSRPPPGIDPWTVQQVGNRYIDYATLSMISRHEGPIIHRENREMIKESSN